jgi:hypothetical protein
MLGYNVNKRKGRAEMKKITTFCAIAAIAALTPCYTFAQDLKILLNGTPLQFDTQPQIINGRTMVPLRAIFEALGATVSWEPATSKITATKDETRLELTLNSEQAKVNDKAVILDAPAVSINGRTLVPLRFISENMNMNVLWDGDTSTIIINAPVLTSKYGRIEEIYSDGGSLFMRIDTGTPYKRSTTEDGQDVYIVPLTDRSPLKVGQRITIVGEVGENISYISKYGIKCTFPSFKMQTYSTTPPIGQRGQ